MSFAADLAAMAEGPLGRDATYTPGGGDPVPLRVILRGGDFPSDFGPGAEIHAMAGFLIPAAGLDRPASGDRIECGGVAYILVEDARRDARGLCWRVEAREA